MRVKDRAKNGASKRAGRGWGRKVTVGNLPSPPPPPLSFFGPRFICDAAKTENRVPRSLSFFVPKPNGNACYAGCERSILGQLRLKFQKVGRRRLY